MDALRHARRALGISQRAAAARAGLSFRGYQLLEQEDHDARIGSLERAAAAVGLPKSGIRRAVSDFLVLPPESIRAAGFRILEDGEESWSLHLFDFVDAFRRSPAAGLVESPPPPLGSARLEAILAATVEALSVEAGRAVPGWVDAVPPLSRPWFVSGMENLKATALVESPVAFRRRNVFVLANFLDRA